MIASKVLWSISALLILANVQVSAFSPCVRGIGRYTPSPRIPSARPRDSQHGGISHILSASTTGGFRLAKGIVRMQTEEPSDQNQPTDLPAKVAVWGAWLTYNFIVFLSDLPCGQNPGELCGITLPTTMEAINLSINFWFVLPAALPSVAPVVHPALEALFNIVVAFGLMFTGFLSDGRGQRVPMFPFMVGTAFLTNVFYLPYLGLRSPQTGESPLPELKETDQKLENFAESKALPASMLAVLAISVLWGCFGRGAEYGDIATRFSALVDMVTHTDRLAHSFMVDSLTFWAFQGWLVPDDMRRRGYSNISAEIIARALPFFGLAWYLLTRPPLPEDWEKGSS